MIFQWFFRRSVVAPAMLFCVLWSLAGCVTEQVGISIPEPSMDEAAALNLQLGIGYLRQNDLRAAQGKLEKAIEQDPDLVMAYTILGLVYERLSDYEAAERSYRRAVTLAPRDPDALNSLAAFLCRTETGRPEALDLFDRALSVSLSQQFSNKAMVNTNAGVCAKQTDLDRAEHYLRAALAENPQYAEALLQLADVSYQRGNYLQSRAFLQRYASVAPPSPAMLWLAMRVETALGDAPAAHDFGLRLKREFPASVETRSLLEQERNAG